MSTTATEKRKNSIKIRKTAVTAVLAAAAAVIQLFEIPLPALIPAFIKLDFSELPALIASFTVSPLAGVPVCLIKNIIKLTTTSSMGVGELCNFLLGIAMVVPAGYIHKFKKNRKGVLIGCLVGCAASAFLSLFVNYYISYPVYYQLLAPEDVVLGLYQKINPNIETIWESLIVFNMPFTFIKMLIDSVITFVVYKPLSNALKKIW